MCTAWRAWPTHFDALAPVLARYYRVICMDVVGRGRSGRLADPRHYVIPQYFNDIVTWLARADAQTVYRVGLRWAA